MIETTALELSECFLKREFLDFTKKNYKGRPLSRKELKLVVEIMFHECLHYKIDAIFGFCPKCSLGLKLGEDSRIIYLNAGCRLKLDVYSLSEYLILAFVVDVLQLIYDMITDIFRFDWYNFSWRIRDFIVGNICSIGPTLKNLLC